MNIFDDFKFNSVKSLIKTFPDEQTCIDFLEKIIWDGEPVSPYDKTAKVYKCKNNRYKCGKTKKYFTVKSITIFRNSNISLQDWFLAIWYYASHKCGLSSMQLHRDLELTQKTTWLLLNKLRKSSSFENGHILANEVEIDETYVGGKNKNRHSNKKFKNSQGRSLNDKTPVFGMIERGGKVNSKVVKSTTANELIPIILRNVELGDTTYTDEWMAYTDLGKYFDHSKVNHGAKQYVVDNAHTNTIENFWSQLKRAIVNPHRFVSSKHLQRYVDEFVFRHNTCKMQTKERFIHLITNIKGSNLTYKELIA